VLTTVWDMRLILSVSVKLQLQQSVDKSAAVKTIRYERCCFNARSKVSLIYRVEPRTTHTHPFNGHFSGTTRVSRYQKGKTKQIQARCPSNSIKGLKASWKDTFVCVSQTLWQAINGAGLLFWRSANWRLGLCKTVKVAYTRLPSVGFCSWTRFLAVSLQVTWVINLAVGCHYFPPGLQLPPQSLRGLLPISLLGEQMGINRLPKTVTRQCQGCDLNPGPCAPESSTLTTWLLTIM